MDGVSANSVMHIAMATNEAYAPHAAVVIRSLMHHHRDRPVCFHFVYEALDDTVEPACFVPLRQVARDCGAEFRALPVPGCWAARLKPHPLFGFHAWLRLLLPVLLPELPRVLYLDADIVVNGSLEALWRIDLQGKLLAAVQNPLYPHQSDAWIRQLDLPDRRHYFNSGVLLLDLAALRAGLWCERLIAFADEHGSSLRFPDQDTLNHLLWEHWLPLPPRYNAQAPHYDLGNRRLPHSPSELREARKAPAIVHFTGQHKPWLDACRNPWRALYWVHLRQTPWRDHEPVAPHWSNAILRRLPYPAYRRIIRLLKPHALLRKPAARS